MTSREPFEHLRALAASDPLKALEEWLATVQDTDPPRRPHEVDDLRAEVMRLHNWAALSAIFDEMAWRAAYSRARARVDVLQRLSENFWGDERDRQNAFYAGLDAEEWPDSKDPSEQELRDLRRFEEYSRFWSSSDYVKWLISGFVRLERRTSSAHTAFAPLRLFEGGGELEQISAAFRVAEIADLRWPKRLQTAVLEAIEGAAEGNAATTILQSHVHMWRLMGAIPNDPGLVAPARKYLRYGQQQDVFSDPFGSAVVGHVAHAVAATRPYSGAQANFFRWLSRTSLWQSEFTDLMVQCVLGEASEANWGIEVALTPLDVWGGLVADFDRQLVAFLEMTDEPTIARIANFVGVSADGWSSRQTVVARLIGVGAAMARPWRRPSLLITEPLQAFSNIVGALRR